MKQQTTPVYGMIDDIHYSFPNKVKYRNHPRNAVCSKAMSTVTHNDNTPHSFLLTPQELSADFLSKVLEKQVTSFQVDSSMMASGILADAYRVHDIQYKEGTNNKSPSILFVKHTKAISSVADLCSVSNTYVEEVYFYQELHKVIRQQVLHVPECYATFHEEDDPTLEYDERVILGQRKWQQLLEDDLTKVGEWMLTAFHSFRTLTKKWQ
jgi:hypothetical protein